MLVHVIGLDNEDPIASYEEIRNELKMYDEELASKDEIILLTKTDLINEEELTLVSKKLKKVISDNEIYTLSAYDEDSIKLFKENLITLLQQKNT